MIGVNFSKMASTSILDDPKIMTKLKEITYSKHPINLILAVGNHAGEYSSAVTTLPWDVIPFPEIRDEKKAFREVTTYTDDPQKRNAIIMGRLTYETFPSAGLSRRLNVVISKTQGKDCLSRGETDDLKAFHSLEDAIHHLNFDPSIEAIFIIGGGHLWYEAINNPLLAPFLYKLYISTINTKEMILKYPGILETYNPGKMINPKTLLRYFPFRDYRKSTISVPTDPKIDIKYFWKQRVFYAQKFETLFTALNLPTDNELPYLSLIQDILYNGDYRMDRTGTGTFATFGNVMRFSLRNGRLPTITTKRMFLKGIVGELIWFIKGCTDADQLSQRGIKIWDANSSKENLQKLGIDRADGDCGPIYGHQWRHWGAPYETAWDNYHGKGIDQLQMVIDKIRSNPYDRRLVVSAWNPSDIPAMALPPCHMMFQFFVAKGELSCMMVQRSADVGLGVPFNITSYCLLTHAIAHICGLKGGEFVHVMGDTHIYTNHVETLLNQLQNPFRCFPTVRFSESVKEIDDLDIEHIFIENYLPTAGPLPMPMAV